jgi:oxygen-independent coproporphyrinogen-3 oxidase
LKIGLYDMLSELTGQQLPWGSLTGIRPTKIPMQFLEQGKTGDEIRQYMKNMYRASDEKIELSIRIAERERALLSRLDYEEGYSLYVGIPFCPSTCLYCSFTSYPLGKWASRMDEYLDALEKEIDFIAQTCKEKHLNSVYIGGGTPTSLTAEQLDRLIGTIGARFDLCDADGKIVYGGEPSGADFGKNHLLEFTVEAGRPDSITKDKLEVIKKHNVSRISINPQTMKDETLKLIGRQHTVQQTIDSFRLAREVGFDNINMDLIVGLPQESLADVRNTMEELKKLDPDNITVHSLAIKRAARLRMEKENYEHLHMENTWETIELTADYCKKMGLEPYYLYRQKNMAGNFENVGYAKPGKAGVYNILIMEEKQTIMALGAGAMTKFVLDGGSRIERVENVKDVTNYLERIDEMIERKRKEMEVLQWL